MRIFLLFLLFYSSNLFAENFRIAVASNFYHTLNLIKTEFQKTNPTKIDLIKGSTGKLFAQIQHGAPYDIFLAADTIRPEKLEQSGFAVEKSRFTYAIGQLAFWSKSKPVNNITTVIKSGNYQKIAIANPKTAPYGKAAVEALKKLKLYTTVKPKLVFGENISQTFQFVHSGSADYGFVALTQIISQAKNQPGEFSIVPANLYSPIEQQLVFLKSSSNKALAEKFIQFMKQESTKALIKNQGYTLP